MKHATRWLIILITLLIALPLTAGRSQNQIAPARPAGVLRLRARVKLGDSNALRGLARKRFFLIHGSLEQNRAVVEAIERQPLLTRDCYYTKNGASPALLNWLKEADCESVYCREIEREFVSGPKAVPEFATAFAASEKEFGNSATALKWLSTNLPASLRDGFYRDRKGVLDALLKQAQASSGTAVQSVMTDRNGTAFFTDLGPGTYVLSNLVPAELGQTLATWNCEVQIKPDDLASEKPYLVSNRKDKLVKCVALEKPVPPCP
ncbi:MAG TPA: hypothetical protein VGW58_06985 [Pyrinomonadaceae bacterium]|nr:hypothetical protein [Pyrinomonadaceae bacterium]